VLASFIVDQIKGLLQGSFLPRGWCYYYCYHGRNQDETTHFLRWIINQLTRQAGVISPELNSLYQDGEEPNVLCLMKALEGSLTMFESVFIVVDALDESQDRQKIIGTLQQLSSEFRFNKIQLLVTSRDEIDIRRELVDLSVSMSLSNEYVDADIRTYIHAALHSLSKNSKFKSWSDTLRDEVEEALVKGAKGM
jgi:hypothetical protein